MVMEEGVELGLKIAATLTLSIPDKVFMVMGEVCIGLIPASTPPIILVGLVDCWVFLFMTIIEVGISIRPDTILCITMA